MERGQFSAGVDTSGLVAPDQRAHQVVAGVLRFGDKALLCHRAPDRRWYPNVWDLPGGRIELGEGPLDALRRELREDLGVEMETVTAEPIARVAGSDFELSVYVVNTWEGRVQNCRTDEHDKIAWFGPRELESLEFAHPAIAAILRELPSGA